MPPEEEKNNIGLPRVRTYKGDVSSVIQDQNISAIDIALAEQKDKLSGNSAVAQEEKPKSNVVSVALSVLLIALGIGAIWYSIYLVNNRNQDSQINPNQTYFKYFEYEKNIDLNLSDLTKLRLSRLVKDLMSEDIRLGAITKFNLIKSSEISETVQQVTLSDFLNSFGANVPEEFLRAVSPDFFFGFYAGVRNYPFVIAEVSSFERAFAGALSWEKDLHWDMEGIVYDKPEEVSTSTVWGYRDVVLNNQDARAYYGQYQDPLFFYTFLENKYILITSDQVVLEQILERLQKTRLAR